MSKADFIFFFVIVAECMLMGAWIQYRASKGESPLPTITRKVEKKKLKPVDALEPRSNI